jgi:flagellar M-ring protein FliF
MILDHQGRPLTRPEDDAGRGELNASQLERQQQIERDLSTKVLAMLEPVVGVGRVRVNVAAHLKADIVEETEERFDPNTVVRSRQTTTETGATTMAAAGMAGNGTGAGGVAGARANQPPALSTSTANAGAAAPTPTAMQGAGRSTELTNYEVGKVVRHTVSPQGQLARLSVAVILDDERVSTPGENGAAATVSARPWEPAGIQRVQGIVAAAVGLDTERGDQLTVENIAFEAVPEMLEPVEPGMGTQAMDLVKVHWLSGVRLV